jgi:hypothetical protein
MAESLEECLARAAACRAAAASEVLDSVRRVHLKAATSWEILAERAQWVSPPPAMPGYAQSRVERDGAKLSSHRSTESDIFHAASARQQESAAPASQNADDGSECRTPPCERTSLISTEDGVLEFTLERDSGACDTGEALQTCTVVLYAADGHLRTLRQIESDLIRLAIQLYDGRMVEVARRLGIGRSTLYRKMSASGMIEPEEACGQKAAVGNR